MSILHVLTVESEKDLTDPVVVERAWDGPTFVVGSMGENILAVNSPNRVVLPFFRRDGDEPERAAALVEAASEHVDYEPEVHMVTVRLVNGESAENHARLAMFVAPEKATIDLTVLPEEQS